MAHIEMYLTLVSRYFIVPKKLTGSVSSEEASMYEDSANVIFASNGWVMGDDPLKNFAERGMYQLETRDQGRG